MRVLCVEDEPALREDIADYLRLHSYEVDEAATGEDAIAQLNQQRYDLVLCDIKMPRMDGLQLLKLLRGENGYTRTPFLFLSALNNRDDMVRAQMQGCDGYLVKPIDFRVLDATIRSHIERQRARDFLSGSILQALQTNAANALDSVLCSELAAATITVEDWERLGSQDPAELAVLKQQLAAANHKLHLLYGQVSSYPLRAEIEDLLLNELLLDTLAELRRLEPAHEVTLPKDKYWGKMLQGDPVLLRRALAVLLADAEPAGSLDQYLDFSSEPGFATLRVADDAALLATEAEALTLISDATILTDLHTDLARRSLALGYALQVAHAHAGRLALYVTPSGRLLVELQVAQSAAPPQLQ
jgi:DNA-binding response OmpR family regulator